MHDEGEHGRRTQTESSGGAGDHPLPAPEAPSGPDDEKVAETQDAAVQQLRDDSADLGSPLSEEPPS